MLACKEEGYILKGQNPSLQPRMSLLWVLKLRGEPETGGLAPAVSSLVIFLIDSLWRDPPRQHGQLLLPRVPQWLLCPHALCLAHLGHARGEGNCDGPPV